MDRIYRKLTPQEVAQLEQQQCSAAQWHDVEVAEGFSPNYLHHTHLSGRVRIGALGDTITLAGGIVRPSGIYHATLHEVTLGDHPCIDGVKGAIAHYHLGDRVVIRDIDTLVVDGECTFGNGVELSVLNEGGGRTLPLYNKLSTQLAYLILFYRHRPRLIAQLIQWIAEYAQSQASTYGTVGEGAVIEHCGTIEGVNIGSYATLIGATHLKNGTVASSQKAPTRVEYGVIAHHFILSTGGYLGNHATLERCFVGQGSRVANHFSAHDTLVFANSQLENGEACSAFCAPYTVSMHKSSLLIGGYYSFMNAGSGCNQSNHMYKLGANHQGVFERGCKLGSNSYLSLPCRIGAFSVVMGAHTSHPDFPSLPFSYLVEQQGESYLVPAVALKSVGVLRDAKKWPQRDTRTDTERLDQIIFPVFSPYTIGKMEQGITLLQELLASSSADPLPYTGALIRRAAAERAIELYRATISSYLGEKLCERLGGFTPSSDSELRHHLKPNYPHNYTQWVDLGSLILPTEELEELLAHIEDGNVPTLYIAEECLAMLARDFDKMEWSYVYLALQRWMGVPATEWSSAHLLALLQQWQRDTEQLDRYMLADIEKEYSPQSKVGFGIDGDTTVRDLDFEQVRGTAAAHPFTQLLTQHIAHTQQQLQQITNQLTPTL